MYGGKTIIKNICESCLGLPEEQRIRWLENQLMLFRQEVFNNPKLIGMKSIPQQQSTLQGSSQQQASSQGPSSEEEGGDWLRTGTTG